MDSTKSSTRTCSEARAWLETYGVSVSEWARLRGFHREIVYAVLSGRTRGLRGQAHDVAVALGIKSSPPATGVSPLDIPPGIDDEQQKVDEAAQRSGRNFAMSP